MPDDPRIHIHVVPGMPKDKMMVVPRREPNESIAAWMARCRAVDGISLDEAAASAIDDINAAMQVALSSFAEALKWMLQAANDIHDKATDDFHIWVARRLGREVGCPVCAMRGNKST